MENQNDPSQTSPESTTSQPTNPTPPLPENKSHSSFLTSKLFLITLVLVILFAIVYSGIYLSLNSKLNQITKPNPTPTITLQPSLTPNETTNPDSIWANWKTYTNTKYNYSLKYPKTLALEEEEDKRDIWINKQILINVTDRKFEGPCGDCPNYNGPTEDIIVANIQAKKYSGEIGAVGGSIPEKFQEVELTHNKLYYTITLHALQYDADVPTIDDYYPIKNGDAQLFDQILSTFQFSP